MHVNSTLRYRNKNPAGQTAIITTSRTFRSKIWTRIGNPVKWLVERGKSVEIMIVRS